MKIGGARRPSGVRATGQASPERADALREQPIAHPQLLFGGQHVAPELRDRPRAARAPGDRDGRYTAYGTRPASPRGACASFSARSTSFAVGCRMSGVHPGVEDHRRGEREHQSLRESHGTCKCSAPAAAGRYNWRRWPASSRSPPRTPRLPKPDWLKVRAPGSPSYLRLKGLMRELNLHTVCEEAHCPNIGECWNHGTATFMILGDVCTRACAYCAVAHGRPAAVDTAEPARVADAIQHARPQLRRHHLGRSRRPAGRRRVDLRRHHPRDARAAARAAGSKC